MANKAPKKRAKGKRKPQLSATASLRICESRFEQMWRATVAIRDNYLHLLAVIRGLIDAQRTNTAKLNELLSRGTVEPYTGQFLEEPDWREDENYQPPWA